MNRSAVQYKSRLKQHLRCSRRTKVKLMESFSHLLNGFLGENPDATTADLCNAFGPPEEMAATLMEQVEEKDKRAYKLQQLVLCTMAIFLASVLILTSIAVFFWKEKPIAVDDDTVTDDFFYISEDSAGGE